MSPYFLALVLTVAVSLLLSLAVMARTIWLRLRPGREAQLGGGHSPGYSNASDPLLLLAVVAPRRLTLRSTVVEY